MAGEAPAMEKKNIYQQPATGAKLSISACENMRVASSVHERLTIFLVVRILHSAEDELRLVIDILFYQPGEAP